MKYLILLSLLVTGYFVKAQQPVPVDAATLIPAYKLDISWHKTTLLIFPAPVLDADRGDEYVLAETVKDADNILKIKAGQKGFRESNFQVVTKDGKVYPFIVNYSEDAPCLPVDMGRQAPYAPVTFKGASLNSEQLETYATKVSGSLPFVSGRAYHKNGMHFALDGIYIKDDVLFFQFHLKNKTQIRYDAASLRFFVRDKKSVKRTASQDKEITPLYVKHTGLPESGKGQVIVVAFPKFTISEKKSVTAELMELGGDRNPVTRLDQKKLLMARPL